MRLAAAAADRRSLVSLSLLVLAACDNHTTIAGPLTTPAVPLPPITPAATAPSVSGMKFNAAVVKGQAMPVVELATADSTRTMVEYYIEFATDGTVSSYARWEFHFTQPGKDYTVSGRNHGAFTQVGAVVAITNPGGGPVMERCTETADGHTLDCDVSATRFAR
jgi:hypothetical protein